MIESVFVLAFFGKRNHFFNYKKPLFIYLDKFFYIIRIYKKSFFNFVVEIEKGSFSKKKKKVVFSFNYIKNLSFIIYFFF